MSERIIDERLDEIENGWQWKINDAAAELLQALKAEREYASELEDFRFHVKDAVSQCQDKGFDVVPITVLEYLLEKVAK